MIKKLFHSSIVIKIETILSLPSLKVQLYLIFITIHQKNLYQQKTLNVQQLKYEIDILLEIQNSKNWSKLIMILFGNQKVSDGIYDS